MLHKVIIALIALGIVLTVFCKVLYDKVGDLERANKMLQRALESNIEATREKDERNRHELQQLQKNITNLQKINDACLNSPVDDALIEFLQQLQQDSAGTISFTFAK